MNLITSPNNMSYNKAVNDINRHQKENVKKLNSALTTATQRNASLSATINELSVKVQQIKRQIFLNQGFLDNWSKSSPYSFDTTMLL